MKSSLKFLKRNLLTIFVIIVFIIGMLVLSYFKKLYWDNNDKAAYGSRLDGIENYKLTDEEINTLKETISKDDDVLDLEVSTEGKIINIKVKATERLEVKNAKTMASNWVKLIPDDTRSFFSVQFYFYKETAKNDNSEEEKTSSFPIIGYLHYGNNTISWTKDR